MVSKKLNKKNLGWPLLISIKCKQKFVYIFLLGASLYGLNSKKKNTGAFVPSNYLYHCKTKLKKLRMPRNVLISSRFQFIENCKSQWQSVKLGCFLDILTFWYLNILSFFFFLISWSCANQRTLTDHTDRSCITLL